MANPMPTKSQIQYLESKLHKQEDDNQRLLLLNKLGNHYTYTDVRKAQVFLSEMQEVLDRIGSDYVDFRLNYHWNSALIENHLYNFNLSEFHFEDALKIVEDRGNANQQAELYIDYAGTCLNLDQAALAEKYLTRARKLLDAFPDNRLEARLSCREGFLNLQTRNLSKAVELFLEADKQFDALKVELDLKDYYFQTLIHSGLGKVYEDSDEPNKSIAPYLKVIEMCEQKNMRSRLSWHYLNVGNSYLAVSEDELAEKYFKKALRSPDDNSQQTRANAYANLGFCYFRNKKYDAALELYSRAEQLYKAKNEGDYGNFANVEIWRAYVNEELGRRKKALKHYFSALTYSKKTNDFRQMAGILRQIATFYADEGNFKDA